MLNRLGSTSIASILAIGGLLALGVGGFAAYRSYTGGCGSCCSGEASLATPVALVEGCSSECSAEGKSACAESEECCKGLTAEECCKAKAGCEGEKAGCEGEKSACSAEKASCSEAKSACPAKNAASEEKAHEGCSEAKGEPTAASDKAPCPLCTSKAKS